KSGLREPAPVKALLIAGAVACVGLMLLLPLGAVLTEAFKKGWDVWLAAIGTSDARASIKLTLFVAALSVPLHTVCGVAAAWPLCASGGTGFWRVTLPTIRFSLLYGDLMRNARAMGECGAVSVVCGHIRGETNTMRLQLEALYNDYDFVPAFGVPSLLPHLAV